MAKRLVFKYDGTDYTLEFTRRTVKEMESRGFKITEITDKPMTHLPALFAGAFLAHHKSTKQEVINAIYSKLTEKTELINKLAEMYNDTIMTLMEDPEDDKGNVTWTANW